MKNKRTKRHHGFTLAEVLITLVIIGIIAAITVSTLSVNLQKEHIERCKKYIQPSRKLQIEQFPIMVQCMYGS